MSTIGQVTLLDSGSGQATEHTPIGGSGTGEICIPNISIRERHKRLASGVIMFIVALVVLAILMAIGASQWWRLALFPLFAGAAFGFYQWRGKT